MISVYKFIQKEPKAKRLFRRWLGSDEFINGYHRWCLFLKNCPPTELRQMPEVIKRVEAVKVFECISEPLKIAGC